VTDTAHQTDFVAQVFDRAAPGYGQIRYFPPMGRRLVTFASLRRGARVLDLATGRGAVLFAAAERVGPEGRVVGVDLSDGMVRETRAVVRQRGLAHVEVLQMDAGRLEFPDASFDAVLCGFGLAFFPRLERTLAEVLRVLRPGGRLAVSTWGEEDPRWAWYDALLDAHQPPVPVRAQALDRSEALLTVLQAAGFSEAQTITTGFDWVCDEAEWWATQWAISGRARLEQMPPEVWARFRAEVDRRLRAMRGPQGLHCRLQAHLARAARPTALRRRVASPNQVA
jgi:O-methyltransferase/aklanonic acid methyltransferase